MDWSVEENDVEGTICVRLRGRWEPMEILKAMEALWAAQARTGMLGALWDFREVKASGVPTTDFRDVAVRHLRDRPNLPESKAAVVAAGDLEFGMARMFEAFLEESPVDMQIFRSLEEASAWLAGRP